MYSPRTFSRVFCVRGGGAVGASVGLLHSPEHKALPAGRGVRLWQHSCKQWRRWEAGLGWGEQPFERYPAELKSFCEDGVSKNLRSFMHGRFFSLLGYPFWHTGGCTVRLLLMMHCLFGWSISYYYLLHILKIYLVPYTTLYFLSIYTVYR